MSGSSCNRDGIVIVSGFGGSVTAQRVGSS
jgi:hypothetical protein